MRSPTRPNRLGDDVYEFSPPHMAEGDPNVFDQPLLEEKLPH